MRPDQPEYKAVADILALVTQSPDQDFTDKAHIRVNGDWLAVARDSIDALLDQASAANVIYPTMYGMMSVTIFREPRLLFISTRITALGAWAVSTYEGKQADDLMAHIDTMIGAGVQEMVGHEEQIDHDNLTLDLPDLGEPLIIETPMYDGDPID